MTGQDYLALGLFALATLVLARRGYRAFFGKASSGCGTGCGTCPSGQTPAASSAPVLQIGPPPR